MTVALFVVVGAMALAAPRKAPEAAAAPVDQATKDAKRAFETAQKAYKQKKYADAISSFENAYRLKPHPVIRFNIARCYEQLNDAPNALKFYRTFLFEQPDSADREEVLKAIPVLERKLGAKNLQQLMVLAEPRDAPR